MENHSSSPILLEPLKRATLTVESIEKHKVATRPSDGKKVLDTRPEPPTKILAKISNAKASSSILAGIGAVLEAAAARPTTATTTGMNASTGETYVSRTTINDTDQKSRAILDRRATQIASTDAWYESFKRSVNAGILRRNTVFPGEGVNGYIYFQASTLSPPGPDRRYVVNLSLPEGQQVVTFEPIAGE